MRARTIGPFISVCPLTIGVDQKLSLARQVMREHGVRHLPVLEAGQPVGILSQRDVYFLGTIAGDALEGVTVEEAMTRDPYVVDPEAPLERVAREMAKRRYGCALVKARSEIVGIFTTTDGMRALASVLAERRRREPGTARAPRKRARKAAAR